MAGEGKKWRRVLIWVLEDLSGEGRNCCGVRESAKLVEIVEKLGYHMCSSETSLLGRCEKSCESIRKS